MRFLADKLKRKIFIPIIAAVLVLVAAVGACAIYLGDYYRADTEAIEAFASISSVTCRTLDNGTGNTANAYPRMSMPRHERNVRKSSQS